MEALRHALDELEKEEVGAVHGGWDAKANVGAFPIAAKRRVVLDIVGDEGKLVEAVDALLELLEIAVVNLKDVSESLDGFAADAFAWVVKNVVAGL